MALYEQGRVFHMPELHGLEEQMTRMTRRGYEGGGSPDRVDALVDAWEPLEVPLGEDSEAYLLRVVKDGVILREETLSAPIFSYGFAAQTADGAVAPFVVEVAQISATYGAGLFASTVIT